MSHDESKKRKLSVGELEAQCKDKKVKFLHAKQEYDEAQKTLDEHPERKKEAKAGIQAWADGLVKAGMDKMTKQVLVWEQACQGNSELAEVHKWLRDVAPKILCDWVDFSISYGEPENGLAPVIIKIGFSHKDDEGEFVMVEFNESLPEETWTVESFQDDDEVIDLETLDLATAMWQCRTDKSWGQLMESIDEDGCKPEETRAAIAAFLIVYGQDICPEFKSCVASKSE